MKKPIKMLAAVSCIFLALSAINATIASTVNPQPLATKKITINYEKSINTKNVESLLISDLIDKNGISKNAETSKALNVPTFAGADFVASENYSQVIEKLKKSLQELEAFQDMSEEIVEDEAAEAGESAPDSMGRPSAKTNYSTTNNQVKDVQESDIIKTDGKYIYTLSTQQPEVVYSSKPQSVGASKSSVDIIPVPEYKEPKSILHILSANGSSIKSLSKIVSTLSGERFSDLYLSGDKMVLVSSSYQETKSAKISPYPNYYQSNQFTNFHVYNISNRSKPILERSVQIEGSLIGSRFFNNTIFFLTSSYLPPITYATATLESIIPTYRDSLVGTASFLVAPNAIYCMPEANNSTFTQIGSFDIDKKTTLDLQSIFGYGDNVYMNTNSFYLISQQWRHNATTISKFAISKNNRLRYSSTAKIDGTLVNQYSLDEYNGNLRVATTLNNNFNRDSTNEMHVFNSKMQPIGSVKGLAKGERIYSVRFVGDIGYMVTFKNTDPLFVVDLANPSKPKVVGELKIPGFSNYLHPIGKNLMLGLGKETAETFIIDSSGQKLSTGFIETGFKISLFDVANMSKPREIDKLVLGNASAYSQALYNPKTIMFDNNKNRFALPVSSYNDVIQPFDSGNFKLESRQNGIVVSVKDNNKLVLNAALDLSKGDVKNNYYSNDSKSRFIYIGNTLYFSNSEKINAYDYNSFELKSTYILNNK